MSTDIQHSAPQAPFRDYPAIDEQLDHRENTRVETAITVVAAVITVLFVSFAAVVMAMS